MTKASDNVFPRFLVSEGGSTSTPAANRVTVYAKADGLLYSKDDAGTEKLLSSGPAAGVSSGTANPSSPTTNDQFFRTDLGEYIYYDGTRWLTTTIGEIALRQESAVTWPLTATTSAVHRGHLPTQNDLWLVSWETTSGVLTTNTGSAYWTGVVRKYNSAGAGDTDVATFATSADTADTYYRKSVAIGALLGSFVGLYTVATKTSTPGNWRFHGGSIRYRRVIT